MLTFQIGLHIDDLFILEYIKNYLNCRHISISGKFCNYLINDCCPIVLILTVPLLLLAIYRACSCFLLLSNDVN